MPPPPARGTPALAGGGHRNYVPVCFLLQSFAKLGVHERQCAVSAHPDLVDNTLEKRLLLDLLVHKSPEEILCGEIVLLNGMKQG